MSGSGRRWLRWVRPAAALALIAYLVVEIGLGELADALGELTPVAIVAGLAVIALDALVRSFNWTILLRASHEGVAFGSTLYAYLAGGFWGSLVPSSLGPDLARALLAARTQRLPLASATVSVLLLNAVSLWALGCLAAVSSGLWIGSGRMPVLFQSVLVVALGIVIVLPLLLAFHNRFRSRVPVPAFLQEPLARLEPASRLAERGPLLRVAGLAAISHLLHVVLAWVLAWGLGLDVAGRVLLLVLPIIVLARLLPISIAGFGAEQGIFTFVFQAVGVAPAAAFALSLVMSGSVLLFTALCGLVAMRGMRPASELRAPEPDGGPERGPEGPRVTGTGAAPEET